MWKKESNKDNNFGVERGTTRAANEYCYVNMELPSQQPTALLLPPQPTAAKTTHSSILVTVADVPPRAPLLHRPRTFQ